MWGGGGWKGANYFLGELALSRRGTVYHTCHGREILTCMFRALFLHFSRNIPD